MDDMPIGLLVSIIGFGLGGVFGFTAQRTNFCTMGAISDIAFMGNWTRFRAWIFAIAVAIIGSQYLYMTETVDLSKAIYLSSNLGWAGAIIGGLMFGFGMTMGGGCGSKTLVRLGAGNLKSLIVAIFIGVFAYMTLRGLVGVARVQMEAVTMIDLAARGLDNQGIPDFLASFGLNIDTARWLTVIVISGGMLWFCFKDADFRASKPALISGLVIGLLIPAAWYVTGYVGNDDFDPTPVVSFTFVAPVGQSLQYLMTFTGSTINFGIAVVGGVIIGAFIAAITSGEFQIEGFNDTTDMGRHLFGGALMGVGGVLALGCTIGQGITGMSTLAFGSVLALVSIIAGGFFGMKYLEEESLGGALRGLFSSE